VLPLMGLALAVPDHTTLSRRARTWQSPNKAHARLTLRCSFTASTAKPDGARQARGNRCCIS
ncbi:hypothetical protein GFL49_38415, partial [Rhizobium leguminosarum bv. viciae]|nr:hypothetical protein [Rhizobium leguminosarum bv. viciae]